MGCSRLIGRGVGGLSIFLVFWSGPWYVTNGDNGRFLSSLEISPGWLCNILLGGEWSASFLPIGGVGSNPSFLLSSASDIVLETPVVSSVVNIPQVSLLSPVNEIGLNTASGLFCSVAVGEGGNTSSNSKLKISSISTENADRGEGKSKLEISDGVDRFECESDCFSVVSDEQDVVVPCLISSHNLCSSSAF